eukprot:656339-Amphidinium_carterae.1
MLQWRLAKFLGSVSLDSFGFLRGKDAADCSERVQAVHTSIRRTVTAFCAETLSDSVGKAGDEQQVCVRGKRFACDWQLSC